MRDIFERIYDENEWGSKESVSGRGSEMEPTSRLRLSLPPLLADFHIRSILDIPCGDYHWWSQMEIVSKLTYIGADIVPDLIKKNRKKFPGVDFRVMDVTRDHLPKVDAIFVRDCFGHLDNASVTLAMENIRRSDIRYLLTTTFPDEATNSNIKIGQWRAINMEAFGLTNALRMIHEGFVEFGDMHMSPKCLGLWDLTNGR
jgi:hypothetical protein